MTEEVEKGVIRHRRNLWLNGLDVFNFSVREAPININTLMQFAHCTQDEIDYFIFHQANLLMDETIRKKLKIPAEKVPYSLYDFGNTSSASIPLTIVSQLKIKLKSQLNCCSLDLVLGYRGVQQFSKRRTYVVQTYCIFEIQHDRNTVSFK